MLVLFNPLSANTFHLLFIMNEKHFLNDEETKNTFFSGGGIQKVNSCEMY